jgi:hypothetical protein
LDQHLAKLQWCFHCDWRLTSQLQKCNNLCATDWVEAAQWVNQLICTSLAKAY